MNQNLLLATDVYKFGHLYQYPEGTKKVFSYFQARTNRHGYSECVFYGLQYYLIEYLTRTITGDDVVEFVATAESILGPGAVEPWHYYDLVELGYLPIEIRAVPEGTVVPIQNVLFTITNTVDGFGWLVGFLESLLLKVWNTCTVATNSLHIKRKCIEYGEQTCDGLEHIPFQIHDFGYRGCSSEETAMLSASAHLLSFLGTDTVPAIPFIHEYYGLNDGEPAGLSVPASEHSVMCAYTRDGEIDAFRNMLKTYPTGIVSIVSDTYDFWHVMTEFTRELRDDIMARDGKVVFRPDSGNPPKIICGDQNARVGSPEHKGALRLLYEVFGGTRNKKGFAELDSHVGLIYGDGIYFERMEHIFRRMEGMRYATSNIVFGMGGLLLQNFTRDHLGFALKATYCEVGDEQRELFKDPITDRTKKSHKGRLAFRHDATGNFVTVDELSAEEADDTLLETVFLDGKVTNHQTFSQVRETLNGDT